MGATVLAVVQGPTSPSGLASVYRHSLWETLPPMAALAAVVVMGIWIPAPLYLFVQRAAAMLEPAR
jgi:hypothetical protein